MRHLNSPTAFSRKCIFYEIFNHCRIFGTHCMYRMSHFKRSTWIFWKQNKIQISFLW